MRCLKPNAIRKGAAVQASFLRPRSLKAYIALVPIIAGLALSHTAMIVAGFSGLTSGFEVLRGGLGTCIAAVPMLAAMVMLYKTKGPLSEKAVDAAFFVSIIVQSGSIIAFGSITLEGPAASAISTGLSAVCSLASWIAILTWLRHIQAASSFTAVLVAFGTLSVAQPVLYAFMLLPPDEACLIAGILAVLQAPLALYIHKRNPFEHFAESANTGYFGFEGAKTDTPRLFLTMTLSVFALSLAMGVVEGSPFRFIEGSAPLPDVGYVAVTTAVTVGVIIGAAWRPRTDDDYRHLDSLAGAWHYRTFILRGISRTALYRRSAFNHAQRRYDRPGMVPDHGVFTLRNERPLLLRPGRLAGLSCAARDSADNSRPLPHRTSHRPFAFDRPHRRDDAGVHAIRVHPAS